MSSTLLENLPVIFTRKVNLKYTDSCQSCPQVTFLGPDPTRPGEMLSRPDPRLPTKSLTQHDPLHMYYMFLGFNIQFANRNDIQYLHDFEGNSENYFISGLVMFPEGEKKRSRVVLFFKTVVSRQQKDCKYQMLVKCIQADQSHQPEFQTRSDVYEFNITSTLYKPAIVILIKIIIYGSKRPKFSSDWAN